MYMVILCRTLIMHALARNCRFSNWRRAFLPAIDGRGFRADLANELKEALPLDKQFEVVLHVSGMRRQPASDSGWAV